MSSVRTDRTSVSLAFLATVLALPAQAKDPAGASGRYRENLRPRASVPGLRTAEAKELNQAVSRLADVLRKTPAVRRPPEGYCTQLSSFIEEVPGDRGRASVDVQFPVLLGGRCRESMAGGIFINANAPATLLGPALTLQGAPADDGEGTFHAMPRPLPARDGWAQYEVGRSPRVRALVLTRRKEPVFIPVTRDRYLRALEQSVAHTLERTRKSHARNEANIQKMVKASPALAEKAPQLLAKSERALAEIAARLETVRRARATLPPDALAAQACYTLRVEEAVTPTARCAQGQWLVSLNPRFFDPALSRGAVQLLVVSSAAERSRVTSAATFDRANEIWESLDLGALAAVLR